MEESIEEMAYFAAVGGTISDLSNIDFSPWGIKCYALNSEEFKEYLIEISIEKNKYNFDRIYKSSKSSFHDENSLHIDSGQMCILAPQSLEMLPKENDYHEAINALLLIYPSELYIRNIFCAQVFDKKQIRIDSWNHLPPSNLWIENGPYGNHLCYPPDQFTEANNFLRLFKANISKLPYVQNALRYYISSFKINHPEMSFVCLCICLETIVPSPEQLSYRFKRNLAVLCGDNISHGKNIYSNANKLYSLRSNLVHSGMNSKDYKKFSKYLEYTQILSSRMIIEMLLHNVPSIRDLDSKINELGIGQGKSISSNYTKFKGNIIQWGKLYSYKL